MYAPTIYAVKDEHMIRSIVLSLICTIERWTRSKIIWFRNPERMSLGLTAAKSRFGFWYVGNVFDRSDIAYGIARAGVVEPNDTELVAKVLAHINERSHTVTFYDIGANTGYYGILSAYIYHQSNARSVFFEPIREHIACIKETARLNSLTSQCVVDEIALSDAQGDASCFVAGSGTTLTQNFSANISQTITVHTDTLDNRIKDLNLSPPHFIKIDVEGHEYAVLKGASAILASNHPVLFIELFKDLHHIDRSYVNPLYHKTFAFLASYGYKSYVYENKKIRSFLHESENAPGAMILFLHSGSHAYILDHEKHH